MRALLLLLLVACDQGKSAPQPVVVAPAPVPADAMPLGELPTSHRASIASPPRSDWPCAFEVEEHQGIHARGKSVFKYGERTACRMPLTLVAQGIWGCPESFTRTDTDGMVRQRYFRYDAEDRLVAYDGHMRHAFAWDGDRLVSATTQNVDGPHTVEYRDRGDEIVAVENDKLDEVLRLDSTGAVVEIVQYVYGREAARARISWAGGKPQSIHVDVKGPVRGNVSRRLRYDCASD